MSSPCLLPFVLLLSATMLGGCIESAVTATCTSMAEQRCSSCYTCARDTDGLAGHDLCGVNDLSTEAQCVALLTEICEDQTNARQLTLDALEDCEESLMEAASQCEPLYQTATQGHDSLPEECTRFF